MTCRWRKRTQYRCPVIKVDAEGRAMRQYPSIRAAAKDNYITPQTASNWINGKVDIVSVVERYGFTFRYDE